MNAASHWPNTQFVGIDLVAIQPDPLALEKIAALKSAYKNRTTKQSKTRHFNPSSENVLKNNSSNLSPRLSFSISAPDINSARASSNVNAKSLASDNVPAITASSNSVYNRIQWVQHNFLQKRLPFQENEFDLVHVRGIAHGVPEDKVCYHLLFNLSSLITPVSLCHRVSITLPPRVSLMESHGCS
jgi:hypothetical protein